MPAPSADLIARMGPTVAPFERNPLRKVLPGEDKLFTEYVIDISNGTIPVGKVLFESKEQILQSSSQANSSTRYLWIIDESGLRIILENLDNPYSARRKMVHTNITGGAKALQGGELWFSDEGKVYINNRSGRYGANSLIQREAILEYIRDIGFDVEQIS